jgi:hypothetical protein
MLAMMAEHLMRSYEDGLGDSFLSRVGAWDRDHHNIVR